MDAASVTALAALAGSAIGGLTSFASGWAGQHAQARARTIADAETKREALYGRFIDEASRLYANALQNHQQSVESLAGLYTMVNQMRLLSCPEVVGAAESVIRAVVEKYLEPDKTFDELREALLDTQDDPLRPFSEACRSELQAFSPTWRRRPL